MAVNSSWCCFGDENGLRDPTHCLGVNYLDVCERAHGANSEQAGYVAENLRLLLETGKGAFRCVYPCHSPTEQRWFQQDGRAFKEEDETIVVVTHHDVSQVRSEIEQARNELEQVLECMPDAFFTMDREGRLTYVNKETEIVLGKARTELVGRRLWYEWPAARNSQFQQECESGLTEQSHFRFEEFYPELQRWFDVLAYACGQRVSVRLIDITQQKQRTEELQVSRQHEEEHAKELEGKLEERTAKLSERERAMRSFLYYIGHSLKAPLRASQGFGYLLVQKHDESLNAESRALLRRMIAAAETMSTLIDALLDFGRLGLESLTLQAIDVGGSVAEVFRSLEAEVRNRHAEIIAQEGMPPVLADARLLRRVLYELVSNAIKFVPPSKVPQVRVGAEIHGEKLRITVEDNGIGIRREYLERIFQVFERLPQRWENFGTGIGLAIAKQAMDMMGGRIGVESQPEVGSRFWIELNRERECAASSLKQTKDGA